MRMTLEQIYRALDEFLNVYFIVQRSGRNGFRSSELIGKICTFNDMPDEFKMIVEHMDSPKDVMDQMNLFLVKAISDMILDKIIQEKSVSVGWVHWHACYPFDEHDMKSIFQCFLAIIDSINKEMRNKLRDKEHSKRNINILNVATRGLSKPVEFLINNKSVKKRIKLNFREESFETLVVVKRYEN